MIQIYENFSLKDYNTFGIEVKARFFIEIFQEQDLLDLMQSPIFTKHKVLFLGGGSNVLFLDDFDGLVLKISIKGITVINKEGDFTYISASAGEDWEEFVSFCVNSGLSGIENLTLIPGNVGTSPMQNIGAYGVELKDIFYSLEAIHIDSCQKKVFYKSDCKFGYRESVFKSIAKNTYVITSVCFKLKHANHNLKTHYGAISSILQEREIDNPSTMDVKSAIMEIRESKLPDPTILGNAGSFFKNPIVDSVRLQNLLNTYPQMPYYEQEDGFKLAAAWLIEKAGLKGMRMGNAAVHDKQALVIVNKGGASGQEVLKLAQNVQDSIYKLFHVKLQPEVNII